MKLIEFTRSQAQSVELFNSVSAASLPLGDGQGEAHVHCVFFDAGGKIGEHPTGFAQLFLVTEGSGWATGADGRRVELHAGQGVYFERGENHSEGSETGMTAIMVQVSEMESR
jgi:quercetin dioxygenase-like cupin family protein